MRMDPDPVLVVERLAKSYRRRPVLRDVNLIVRPGEAVAVIGPNGAGKSTLLGCLTGERLPDEGRIRIGGFDPFRDASRVAERVGYVPEHPFLYGELTVSETLDFVAGARRLDPAVAAGEKLRLLEIFGLAGAESVLARELSQGMGRKVAVVAALLHRPALLILDEVFNGLDRPSTDRLLGELDERRSRGSAILLSSHDLELLAGWSDRGLLLAPDGVHLLEGEAWRRWRENPGLARV